jgi:hypothetical protein
VTARRCRDRAKNASRICPTTSVSVIAIYHSPPSQKGTDPIAARRPNRDVGAAFIRSYEPITIRAKNPLTVSEGIYEAATYLAKALNTSKS